MGKFNVLVTRADIYKDALNLLKEKCNVEIYNEKSPIPKDIFLKMAAGKEGIYTFFHDVVDQDILEAAGPQLKVVSTASVGFNQIDIQECKLRNVKVGHSQDPNVSDCVAEITISLMIMTARRMLEAIRAIPQNKWDPTWPADFLLSSSIFDATVGIVGMGKIGQAVAERLVPFKVKKILYSDINPVSLDNNLNAKFVSFEELIKESDFVVCTCILNEETHELFNSKIFEKMKSTAIFINTSRGGLVNHDDLYEALLSRKIGAAGLDVMVPEPLPSDHKLLQLPNIVLLPHIGTNVYKVRNQMATLAAKNLLAGLQGEKLPASAW